MLVLSCFLMERETRLELATSSLARRHSTTELPPHIFAFIIQIASGILFTHALGIIIIHGNKLLSSVYFIKTLTQLFS